MVLQLKFNDFKIGKCLWKFNNSFLYDKEYIDIVKRVINNVKEQYAALTYNRENLTDINNNDICFTINDQLFLETLLLEIRGKTISYASHVKKERNQLENLLCVQIQKLESKVENPEILANIEEKKAELKILRDEKMRGHYVRSRMQWIEEGEKPSKYFSNLETRNFVNKTIPKLITERGDTIHEQKEILTEATLYYKNLYSKRDMIHDIDLKNELPYLDIPKLNDDIKESLEGEITLTELLSALKRMKNGKSPGSDGYTVEFFKVFWNEIGEFILRSINYGYSNGEMSITQKLGIITCIPKGDKPRQYMKNWRPISLLNVCYKLASSCIAERIKSVLSTLINSDQTGFIPGRYIGENTRLIYDILHYTEEKDIPGILLLIDFEKAFDSVSWDFIKKVLDFFNFGPSITKWINTFYKNITSSVTQNCCLSDSFEIQRGCRQGDPLSPYIFLLCAEILGILVRKNEGITGITIDDTEFLISQYADDTSLILDGTPETLDASLRTLQHFAEMSGLNINIDKTKVVWIGKKKYSQDRICVKWGLEWGSSRFTLLGIQFSVDLKEMEKMNYKSKFKEIENIIKAWTNHILTPIGKITVIKTLIISKLNHLFLTIPAPNKLNVDKFVKLLFSFIWDDKPDKVKREILSQTHDLGGLKMLDIDAYIKGLKLTWIRRVLKCNSKLIKLLTFTENIDLEKLAYIGPLKKLNNPFWREVFECWSELKSKQSIENKIYFTECCIWNNANVKINNNPVTYKSWIEKGVLLINDLLDEKGEFMTYETFEDSFQVNTNFLTYHGLISTIKSYMRLLKISVLKKQFGPIIPNIIKPFLLSEKGSKDMYKILTNVEIKLKCEEKWQRDFQQIYEWKKIHNMSFITTKSTKLQWFQYRIIHRILGTNEFLFKIKQKDNDKCTFCNEFTESIHHIFWSCPKVSELWEQLNYWVFDKTQIELPLNSDIVLFGILQKTERNNTRNLIILLSKYYIYRTKMREERLNIIALKNYLKENLKLEKNIFFKNNCLERANTCWDPWLAILD